jgi:hypothetical protein
MMSVSINDGRFRIALSGWDRVWTLRRELAVPIERIASVQIAPELTRPYGVKTPGSAIPGRIYAGTWRWKGRKEFWNVRREKDKWVAIDLDGDEYNRIVIEVDDPATLVAEIERARRF